MTQSNLSLLHVAIIMDGNGRWATARRLPRLRGHHAGAVALERTVEAAARLGLGVLTVYAFSADNWRRPGVEVDGLMALFEEQLRRQAERCRRHSIRLSVIGRRDRLGSALVAAIDDAERRTAHGEGLHLRLAVDYSARHAIAEAASRGGVTRDGLDRALGPAVDLLIRTGGEQRLSDFLLWEAAYAELVFTPRMWPEFGPDDLNAALAQFRGRDRRFGALSPAS